MNRRSRQLWAAVGVLLFLLLWDVTARVLGRSIVFPGPYVVITAFIEMARNGVLFKNAEASLWRVLLGCALAAMTAIPFGLLVALAPTVHKIIRPLFELLRPLPGLAVLPVFLLLFGIGDLLPISIVAYAAFFPILLNTIGSVQQTDVIHEEAARTMGARRRDILFHVILPSAFPGILIGLRVGVGLAWMTIIGAELIGSDAGLGFMIMSYQQNVQSAGVFVGMICVGVIGLSLDFILRTFGRYAAPWQSQSALQG